MGGLKEEQLWKKSVCYLQNSSQSGCSTHTSPLSRHRWTFAVAALTVIMWVVRGCTSAVTKAPSVAANRHNMCPDTDRQGGRQAIHRQARKRKRVRELEYICTRIFMLPSGFASLVGMMPLKEITQPASTPIFRWLTIRATHGLAADT